VKYNLFRAHTRSDGNAANTDVKISIANIRPDPNGLTYGTFTLLVRDFADTDSKITVLEQFDNLTLDPSSPNYVPVRVGTQYQVIDSTQHIHIEGDYPNNSRYIYLEMDANVEEVPFQALPYGFAALATPLDETTVPAPAYVVTRYTTPAGSTVSVANNNIFYGYNFADETGLSYLNPTPSGSVDSNGDTLVVGVFPSGSTSYPVGGTDPGFDLLTMLNTTDETDISPVAATNLRKFSVPFQGGFDGQSFSVNRAIGSNIVPTNTQGFDLSTSTSDGSKAYIIAINALSNPDAYDINLLVTPGVIYSQHAYVASAGITMCETRADCFYVLDGSTLDATVDTAENDITGLDSNYAATYFPWLKVRDATNNKTVWVPPSTIIPSVYAFSDRVSAEWYAPAGLNRGGIGLALDVRKRLSQADRDELYPGRVNALASFPGQGIAAWGQKTLQVDASALDRINVRRLLIALKKFVASTSRYVLFEPNTDATRQRFLSVVNPYLQSVQQRQGLYSFRVVADDTNNTPDTIDRNLLVVQIYLQPTKAIEFISLQFNILPTGAQVTETTSTGQ
jgi:hypothetical protein